MPYRAVSLEPGNMMHRVELDEGREIVARAVLLATGADYRRLAIPDLERYEGLSIFYAAAPPEARACSGTRVGVIGGGNSAGQAAVWLAGTPSPATTTASSSRETPPAPRGLLETSVSGIYTAGDVRAGSTKRCATAVGEGAAVVGYVHERLAAVTA
jgi:thioredoxin reductase